MVLRLQQNIAMGCLDQLKRLLNTLVGFFIALSFSCFLAIGLTYVPNARASDATNDGSEISEDLCNWWLFNSKAPIYDLVLKRLKPHDQTSYYPITNVTPLSQLLPEDSKLKVLATSEIIRKVFLNQTTPRRQLSAALDYLKTIQPQTQINLAIQFEEFAKEIMVQSSNDWQSYRYFGKDGSLVYSGLAGHGLVITSQGQIYTGIIERKFLRNDAKWIPNYSRLNPLDPEFFNHLGE